nr:hypothetical protein [Microbacterium sp. NIBRBAC000506063]
MSALSGIQSLLPSRDDYRGLGRSWRVDLAAGSPSASSHCPSPSPSG